MTELVLVANAADSTISTFRVDTAAHPPTLERIAVSEVGEGCGTFAIDADRDLVYAAAKGDPPGIDVFALDRETGRLEHLDRTDVEGSMSYLALAHGGSLLVGASYGGGNAQVFPVGDEGHVEEPTAQVSWPNAHCVALAADGRHLYVVSLGADVVAQYSLSPGGGLTPLVPPTAEAPEGSGPRHLVLDAAEERAYVMTEFSGEALTYDRDASGDLTLSGSVPAYAQDRGLRHSELGADPVEGHLIWGADLHLARQGAYLLASERSESTLACLPVNPDGSLGEAVSIVGTVAQPRGFLVLADDRYALVTGEQDTAVALVAVDEAGLLMEVARAETGHGANWARSLQV
ncbi:beta-propeller fold lactonase family protein [uncultured Serinicoccus sp.]|uniref:lactonase family protein n=1 Tax=uncultured Serinicoccus sp. TaxID=735514 RepID=UPI0026357A06|nr:beta-propeller fold lactonase family protein [uncultured Serinicoccus sp.]